MRARQTKYIFVTGGVLSSLGKGLAAASAGALLEARGLRVTFIKLDPYLNVDPGTMNPIQHGEVYVTDDGAETDLDLGNYERFTDEHLSRLSNVTTGSVYDTVIKRERRGDFLGATVQVIPHVTDEIKSRIHQAGASSGARVVIVEIGGTVGDIESLPFLEAIRQLRNEVGRDRVAFVHVTLVPFLESVGELKTKTTQHSVQELRRIGIEPDVLVLRSDRPLNDEIRGKIALYGGIEQRSVVSAVDASNIYELPLMFEEEGFASVVLDRLGMATGPPNLEDWTRLVRRIHACDGRVRIALVGKYVQLHDAYLSVVEALKHSGVHHGVEVEIDWIDAESANMAQAVGGADGILVPGGFGGRGIEGKIEATRHARENGIPFLGICLGMQVAVIEFARNVAGMAGANSSEFDPATEHPVIDLLPEQKQIEERGGTMRLGADPVHLVEGTMARAAYNDEPVVYERHRHRYEVNPALRPRIESFGLVAGGTSPDGRLVEIIELPDHPWFVASQFHPEFTSRPTRPQPLFREFIGAVAERVGAGVSARSVGA
ncbi:MAG: CTP synthase [Miltoncostaeaceae bacterium]